MEIENRGELSKLVKKYGIETNEILSEDGVKLYHTITYDKRVDKYYRVEWGKITDDDNVTHLWYESEAPQVWLNKSPWKKGWHTKEEIKKIEIEENNKKGDLNMNDYLIHNVEHNLVDIGEKKNLDFKENFKVMGGQAGKGKTLYSVRKAVEALAEDKSVLFFSTETKMQDILQKFKMIMKNDRILELVTDEKFEEEKEKEKFIIDFLFNSKLKVNDHYLLHTNYIVNEMRKQAKSEDGLDYVIIDSLMMVIQDKQQERNSEELYFIQKVLEKVGDELDCDVLVTTQLNFNHV